MVRECVLNNFIDLHVAVQLFLTLVEDTFSHFPYWCLLCQSLICVGFFLGSGFCSTESFFFFFPLMSGYKPFLVPTVLSTERRNSRFLSAPTAQAQQGGRTRGAGKSGICRAVSSLFFTCIISIMNTLY